MSFACHRCHRVRFFTRVRVGEAWNQLIAYLTGGLLYGHEVERPTWFTANRQRPYKPRPGAAPALRREQVARPPAPRRLPRDIAAELRITIGTVTAHANKIYKSERVRGQRALMMKYKKPLPPRLIRRLDRILEALRAGHSPAHRPRPEPSPYLRPARRRATSAASATSPRARPSAPAVAALHAAGLDRHAIAAALNMTPQSVSTRLHELRRAGSLSPPGAGRRAPPRRDRQPAVLPPHRMIFRTDRRLCERRPIAGRPLPRAAPVIMPPPHRRSAFRPPPRLRRSPPTRCGVCR